MDSLILDGTEAARKVRAGIKEKVKALKEAGFPAPVLAVIIVGEDPASQTYVANKEKACGWVGIGSRIIRLPNDCSENVLLEKIDELNRDSSVNGILVQLPLPSHIEERRVIDAIIPEKDVDGFHPINVGRLQIGSGDAFVSCTPAGIIELMHQNGISAEGKHAVVCGRSNIVGKPMAQLLLKENATVTLCHSHTKNLKELTLQADILVCAIGKPLFFDASYIKTGAVVIDVGIHRTENGLVGDADTASMLGIASAYTPVPGGVGPMTIAMLLSNCLKAYENQHHLSKSEASEE